MGRPRPSTVAESVGANCVFARIMVGLAAKDIDPTTIIIDATSLKAHRTACSLRAKKGGVAARSVEQKAA